MGLIEMDNVLFVSNVIKAWKQFLLVSTCYKIVRSYDSRLLGVSIDKDLRGECFLAQAFYLIQFSYLN